MLSQINPHLDWTHTPLSHCRFTTSMAYSSSFNKLVLDMGTSNSTQAANLFYSRWLVNVAPKPSFSSKLLDETVKFMNEFPLYVGIADTSILLKNLYQHGTDWASWVNSLLNVTAAIPPNTTLGSTVQPWANGKIWIICTSISTPTATSPAPNNPAVLSLSSRFGLFGKPVKYVITGAPSALATYTPTRFSVVWGSGNTADAPYSFLCGSALPSNATVTWTLQSSKVSPPLNGLKNLEKGAGGIYLNYAAGSSSAFFGATLTGNFASRLTSFFNGVLVSFVTSDAGNAGPLNGQSKAKYILTQDSENNLLQASVDALASSSMVAIIDGGYTENLGIANAISCGNTKILASALLQWQLAALFAPDAGATSPGYNVEAGQQLGSPNITYPIFQQNRSWARTQIANLTTLPGSLNSSSPYLASIQVGIIRVGYA